jgi:broad specificity phosphatase PhoE
MEQVKEIYLIRHGETDMNQQGLVQGSGVNSSLNTKGILQSNLFFEKYRSEKFDLVITSVLNRSIETVQNFLDLGIPQLQTSDINEMSWGDLEGKKTSEVDRERYKQMILDWSNGKLGSCLPNGESAAQLIDRVDRFLDVLKNISSKKILISSHGRTIRCLVTRMKKESVSYMEHVPHHNLGLFKIRLIDNEFTFETENDISHLKSLIH